MPSMTVNSISNSRDSAMDEKEKFEIRSQSEDSSFYGNETVKAEYARHLSEFDNQDYWRVHKWNVQVIVATKTNSNLGKRKHQKSSLQQDEPEHKKNKKSFGNDTNVELSERVKNIEVLFNPYEDHPAALEIGESVDEFLHRLQPSDPSIGEPWIWCANFKTSHRETIQRLAEFKQIGTRLLEQFSQKRKSLESSFDPPKQPGVISRMLGPDKEQLQSDILKAAKDCRITTGKWMLFASLSKIDEYWAAVVRATVDGRLGISAKVSTTPSSGDLTHVICVYVQDFADQIDVKRILKELIRLKLAAAIPGPLPKVGGGTQKQIYFKADAYTWLDIMGDNEYKLKASMYSTASLLTKDDVQDL